MKPEIKPLTPLLDRRGWDFGVIFLTLVIIWPIIVIAIAVICTSIWKLLHSTHFINRQHTTVHSQKETVV